MNNPHFYAIGNPGQAWGAAELAQWRARQVRQRSYADDVLSSIGRLGARFDVSSYGEVAYAGEHFALLALRSRNWQPELPTALITGGVHGYETSGVHGALGFLEQQAAAYEGRVNLLVAPCVSPAKIGAQPGGSITTNSVAKAVIRKALSIYFVAASSFSCADSHIASARSKASITSAYFLFQVSSSPLRASS